MSLHDAARRYLALGWQLVPVPHRRKGPVLPEWQRLRMTEADVPRLLREPSNVGVILGRVSGGLTDIDLDCPEAVALAELVLPATWTYGRASKPRSHWLYVVPGGMEFRRYLDKLGDKPATMLELRSHAEDEGKAQSVLPPSVHECGEPILWTQDADGSDAPRVVPAEVLLRLVERLAVATLYARHGLMLEVLEWLQPVSGPIGPPPPAPVSLLREAERLRGVVPRAEFARSVGRARNQQRSETLDEAVAAYNQAHRYDWPRSGGQCPMCGHRGCFGRLPEVERWTCHSTSHSGVGVPGEQCHTGDALDIDAHRAGCTRVELLRREGYL